VKKANGVVLGRPREIPAETVERIRQLWETRPQRKRHCPTLERGRSPDASERPLARARSPQGARMGSLVKNADDSGEVVLGGG
jgi:hypothetical protein